MIEMIKEIT